MRSQSSALVVHSSQARWAPRPEVLTVAQGGDESSWPLPFPSAGRGMVLGFLRVLTGSLRAASLRVSLTALCVGRTPTGKKS